uniref:Uncharacterized protein n=2 Tax=Macrostomum lignano TaxID=282301 RepID=A0A1I8HJ68_9PLAT
MTDYVGARQLQQQSMPDEFFLPFNYDEQAQPQPRGHLQNPHLLHHQHQQMMADLPPTSGIYDPTIGATIQPMPLLDFHRQQQQLPPHSSAGLKDEYPYSKKSVAHEFDDYPQQQQQQQLSGGVDD